MVADIHSNIEETVACACQHAYMLLSIQIYGNETSLIANIMIDNELHSALLVVIR